MTAGTSYGRRRSPPPAAPTSRPRPAPRTMVRPGGPPRSRRKQWVAMVLAAGVIAVAWYGFRELNAYLNRRVPTLSVVVAGDRAYGPAWGRFQVDWPWLMRPHALDPAGAVVGGRRPRADLAFVAATPAANRFAGTRIPDPILYVEVRRYAPSDAPALLASLQAAARAAGVTASTEGQWATATWDHVVTYPRAAGRPLQVEVAEEEIVDGGTVFFARVGTGDMTGSERLANTFSVVVAPGGTAGTGRPTAAPPAGR